MQWIDTHAHLQDKQFAGEVEEVLSQAVREGVTKIIVPACNELDMLEVYDLCATYPEQCYPAIGLHPGELGENPQRQLEVILRLVDGRGEIAIGEIGLDAYHYADSLAWQIPIFEQQLEWALYYDLPVLIHARETIDQILETLERGKFRAVRGVLHAFEGSVEQLHRAMRNDNLMVGIGGLATFKNGLKEEVLQALDLTRSVLETDSPYLTPTPYRGKRNAPYYIPLVGERLAAVRGEAVERIASLTSEAARQLFPRLG